MRHRQIRFAVRLDCAAAALMLGVFSALSASPAFAQSSLEADVQARADRVAALRRDYDRTVDELEQAPELAPIAATKAKYALQAYSLLLDAQGRQQDAERLLTSQQELMESTRKVIDTALHALPAVAKLADLGRQIAAADAESQQTRTRVVAVAAAARSAQDGGNRLADLKRRQADLESQVARFKAKVAAQTNATLKAHNEALLAKADQLLADGRAQITELEASSAAASARLAEATGESDIAAAKATAQRIVAAWNRASRQRDEAAEILWSLCDLSSTISLSGHGNVSKQTPDGRTIPLDLKKPLELLPGESIRTGGNSEVKLRLFDGSFIQLSGNSNFTLRGPDREDFLEGGAMHRLNRLLNHINKGPRRHTPTAVIAERGTDYVLLADQAQTTCVVRSGEVEVTPTDATIKPMIVTPLQHATLKSDGWHVEPITPDDYERLLASFEPEVN